ncbi:MBL fold metallo-hydrolase [Aliifodinibius sp. S!AR15-10]|uniref:MBL fold metallo-hydrolase n=1 Tax=Aliifodinibius sp. S!AR15-10 TaxID=2950437 RepID=UPI0028584459|nr:MBL fold metallo-hydrolase [Aliifodinibius sp. S!AR15-10]MDR8389665.1 MBL fold metallo-hydrolase [Aliifodinibius sp. S!AR15-10]
MDRRQFLTRSSLAAVGAALPFQKLWAADNFAGTFNDLRRNVGYFTERGGTIGWLATDDVLVVVDSQFPETAKNCLAGLQKRTSHGLDLLINTHHHGDHTGGNPVFKGKAKQMVAHRNVPKLMKQNSEDSETDAGYPGTLFSDSWEMELGGETIHVAHYGPAHTSGDAIIYFENANIAHMGDLVFNRMNPYTDRPAGASIHNWITVLETAMDEYPSDAIYIFGHGHPEFGVTGNRDDVAVMRDYLAAMVEYVEDGIAADRPKEEIVNLQKLDAFPQFQYADWWTLSQNLEVVYAEAKEM